MARSIRESPADRPNSPIPDFRGRIPFRSMRPNIREIIGNWRSYAIKQRSRSLCVGISSCAPGILCRYSSDFRHRSFFHRFRLLTLARRFSQELRRRLHGQRGFLRYMDQREVKKFRRVRHFAQISAPKSTSVTFWRGLSWSVRRIKFPIYHPATNAYISRRSPASPWISDMSFPFSDGNSSAVRAFFFFIFA